MRDSLQYQEGKAIRSTASNCFNDDLSTFGLFEGGTRGKRRASAASFDGGIDWILTFQDEILERSREKIR